MADKTLLPGTDIEIIEKYPNSRRLDFPDFGSVCKSSFAKGVITEVKMLPPKAIDDFGNFWPVFESLAKVDIGGEDYLPFFYHPQKQYWDTNDYKATKLNQEKGYFENAWMSFRGGDEVAVMFKEGVPVTVLGFADGKPRLGEAVVEKNTPAYTAAGVNYPAGMSYLIPWDLTNDVLILLNNTGKGPDGSSLGLVKVDEINDIIIPAGIISNDYNTVAYQVWSPWSSPPQWLTYTDQVYLLEYYFIVGPALFIEQYLNYGTVTSMDQYCPVMVTSRRYAVPFSQSAYNLIRGGGTSAPSAFLSVRNYVWSEAPPPEIQWGTKPPPNAVLLWNYVSAAYGPHPLAPPSFKARPHNPRIGE